MKSIGRTYFYNDYIASLNKEVETKKQRLFELKNSRYHLITVIQDRGFEDAYISLDGKDPVEYMAYFTMVKEMQRHAKLEVCTVINDEGEPHEHSMFLKGTLNNVMKYNRAIKEVEDRLYESNTYKITIEEYRTIIDTYDNLVVRYLLDGKKYSFGAGIGTVCVVEKERTYKKKIVDHNASRKEKERLLANGLIPYRKKEHEEAKKLGIEYKGVEWLIYHYDEKVYYLHWTKTKFIRNSILYSLVPTIANNTNTSVYDIQKETKLENIPNYKLGFVQMLQMIRRISPKHTAIYRNNYINN